MPLDKSFWDSVPSTPIPQRPTTFRGEATLIFVQDNEESPDKFARSSKRPSSNHCFKSARQMTVAFHYITDAFGDPKTGERFSNKTSGVEWVPDRPGVLKATRLNHEHWFIIEEGMR